MALLYCPLPYHSDSAELAAGFASFSDFVLLESNYQSSQQGRFDVISAKAQQTLLLGAQRQLLQKWHTEVNNSVQGTFTDTGLNWPSSAAIAFIEQQIPQAVRQSISQLPTTLQKLPFLSGWIGQLDYELGCEINRLELNSTNKQKTALGQMNYYPWSIVVDHQKQQTWLIAESQFLQKSQPADKTQALEVQQLIAALPFDLQEALHNNRTTTKKTEFTLQQAFKKDTSYKNYQQAFSTIQNYILAGDCYQVNLTQRFSSHYAGDPWQAYLKLRAIAPAPYSGFIRLQGSTLASCSPELFLRIDHQDVSSKPIKGTIATSSDPTIDNNNKRLLQQSSKDIAENIMIVDLLRNDLSKWCQPFSVSSKNPCQLQSFSNVHHLVSEVQGKLKPEASPLMMLFSAFPGGSITGAPKKRAMEIIQEQEHHPRQAYCGSLFSYSCHQQLNANILIRSLLFQNNKVYCWGGGGITAASKLEDEYQESLSKIHSLLTALEVTFTG